MEEEQEKLNEIQNQHSNQAAGFDTGEQVELSAYLQSFEGIITAVPLLRAQLLPFFFFPLSN